MMRGLTLLALFLMACIVTERVKQMGVELVEVVVGLVVWLILHKWRMVDHCYHALVCVMHCN